MYDPYEYNISVKKIIDDGEELYRATVKEFPDLMVFEESFNDAYVSMINVINASIEMLTEQGKKIPEPSSDEDEYSGRITLRMPKSLHKKVTLTAEYEDISINQYLLSAVSYYIGACENNISSSMKQWVSISSAREKTIGSSSEVINQYYKDKFKPLLSGEIKVVELNIEDITRSHEGLLFGFDVDTTDNDYENSHYMPIPR